MFQFNIIFILGVMGGKYFHQFNYGSNWSVIPKSLPEITLLFLIFTHATSSRDVTKSMKTCNGFIKSVVRSDMRSTKKFLKFYMSFTPPWKLIIITKLSFEQQKVNFRCWKSSVRSCWLLYLLKNKRNIGDFVNLKKNMLKEKQSSTKHDWKRQKQEMNTCYVWKLRTLPFKDISLKISQI